MIGAPHYRWADKFKGTIVPETFVEITLGVTDSNAPKNATVATFDACADLSNTIALVGTNETIAEPYYVTLEENRWVLDGTKEVRYALGVPDVGYVGTNPIPGFANPLWYVQITLPDDSSTRVPGIDILWDSEFGEKPSKFNVVLQNTVSGKLYDIVVEGEKTWAYYYPTGRYGDSDFIDVELACDAPGSTKIIGDFSDYNFAYVGIIGWDTPNHRPRMDRFIFGYSWVFDKKDILSFTHEQTGDLLGAELPKNSISFSLDNTDDKWNPNNPNGFGKYVTERQMITVRYGMDVNGNGKPDWIPGGVFYLSDWNAPSNGLEATFTARDPFEFMMSVPYSGIGATSYAWDVIQSALSLCEFPNKLKVRSVDAWWSKVTVNNFGHPVNGVYDHSVAEILQMCSAVMCCVMWFDRYGTLQIVRGPWRYATYLNQVYDIPLDLAYSYPEVSLSKPIKYVSVNCTDSSGTPMHKLIWNDYYNQGATQSFDLLLTEEVYVNHMYGYLMKPAIRYREMVTGEFRADPRLDVFDLVNVETKYGDMQMVLTGIKYTYSGSFHAEYTARKVSFSEAEFPEEGDDSLKEVEI